LPSHINSISICDGLEITKFIPEMLFKAFDNERRFISLYISIEVNIVTTFLKMKSHLS